MGHLKNLARTHMFYMPWAAPIQKFASQSRLVWILLTFLLWLPKDGYVKQKLEACHSNGHQVALLAGWLWYGWSKHLYLMVGTWMGQCCLQLNHRLLHGSDLLCFPGADRHIQGFSTVWSEALSFLTEQWSNGWYHCCLLIWLALCYSLPFAERDRSQASMTRNKYPESDVPILSALH